MVGGLCIILLLGTIPYSLSAPDPLDTLNININLGEGKNTGYGYEQASQDQDDKCITDGGKDTGAQCIFPFIFDGIKYNWCASTGHSQPWCSTMVDGNGVSVKDNWGNCASSCKLHNEANDKCVTDGGKDTGAQCIFPFIFDGIKYNWCTSTEHSQPWCSTMVDGNGVSVKDNWGNCASSCKLHNEANDKCVTKGGKDTGAKCIFPFIFDGTIYNGCSSTGHSQPWCSTMVDGNGEHVKDKWGNCASRCKLHNEGNQPAPQGQLPSGQPQPPSGQLLPEIPAPTPATTPAPTPAPTTTPTATTTPTTTAPEIPAPTPATTPAPTPAPTTTPTATTTPAITSPGCSSCPENEESLSSERIASLREAMRNLQASSDWERVTAMHGEPVRKECNMDLCCIHGGFVGFLPWHRAFVDSFNSALGTVMPYWDWTTSCFPSIAHSAPFSHGLQVFDGITTNRNSSCVQTEGNLDAVLSALREDDFLLFSIQLEDIHDAIHIRLQGTMAALEIAAYDPIFYLHHTFVDLVWAVYQVLKPNVQPSNLTQSLIPLGRTIGQVMSTNRFNLDINSNGIVFGGMTLAQIQTRISSRNIESSVQGEDIIYAGFIKRSYGTSGIIKFNLCNEDDCSYPGGEVNIFGGKKQMSYINSDPTKVDITDAVNKAGIDNIKQLKFKITSFTNLNGNPIKKTIYSPIRIVRPGNGGRNLYGTASKDGYCIFFNRNFIQPPKLRIPKNTMFEIDSSHQNVITTMNRNSYTNCYKGYGTPMPSKTLVKVKHGTYYFFDDDCKPQPKIASTEKSSFSSYISKLQIVKD